jgi:hypothetical protein
MAMVSVNLNIRTCIQITNVLRNLGRIQITAYSIWIFLDDEKSPEFKLISEEKKKKINEKIILPY